ncbi:MULTISPECIES: Gfo/Idh/MocA family oxidoreductase [unclassified Methanoculleus]|uniref:Gfo/Idh/MocA family protein n=1 Tax=unclassified Methanoculleus TaxID=2619537 RepID=UPI00316ACC6C
MFNVVSSKVAVIGGGYWGRKHVEEYVALGNDVYVADLLDKNLEFCSKKYGVSTTKNYRDLLTDDGIKAVSICTPNASHYPLAKEFLESHKNVLVEKPLAMTIDEGRQLIDIAKDNHVVLSVGHIFRFNNAIAKIRDMIEHYEFGDIRIMKLKWTNIEPLFEDRDVIFDLAPHPFDIIHYIFRKNPDEVSCTGNAYRRSKLKGAEAVFINCNLDEMIINIELSWLTPPKTRSLVIVGSKRSALVNCTSQTIEVVENNNSSYNLEIIPNNTLRDELHSFLNCVTAKSEQNISNGYVGLDILKMIEVCNDSLKEKRVLRLNWD